MKYYFPIHLDAGNRGCEAIAKGTAKILGEDKSRLVGLCRDIELDEKLGISNYVQLQKYPKWTFGDKVARRMYFMFVHDANKRKDYYYYKTYAAFLDQGEKADIVLSTGGDMMCYGDNEIIYTTDYAHQHGLKTVLWGCSMGEKNLTKAKRQTLKNFDMIYARESLSYDFFKSLGLKNVVCFPDPAFVLKPEEIELPEIFQMGDVVGINLSNFVLGDFSLETPFGYYVKATIDYILDYTNMQILLIPHVTWDGQDDRLTSQNVKKKYQASDRIEILKIDNLNYCQIRYVISKCKFFIGARTHAVISAYSTCVPTIALGYSIKSKGIAKDIGLPDVLVIDSKKEMRENDLLRSFHHLCDKENEIKTQLGSVMPQYCQRPYQVLNSMKNI